MVIEIWFAYRTNPWEYNLRKPWLCEDKKCFVRQNEIKPSGCEIFLFKLHIMSKNNVLHSFCLSGFSQKRGRFKDLVTICNSNRYYQLQRKESLFLSMLAGFTEAFLGRVRLSDLVNCFQTWNGCWRLLVPTSVKWLTFLTRLIACENCQNKNEYC